MPPNTSNLAPVACVSVLLGLGACCDAGVGQVWITVAKRGVVAGTETLHLGDTVKLGAEALSGRVNDWPTCFRYDTETSPELFSFRSSGAVATISNLGVVVTNTVGTVDLIATTVGVDSRPIKLQVLPQVSSLEAAVTPTDVRLFDSVHIRVRSLNGAGQEVLGFPLRLEVVDSLRRWAWAGPQSRGYQIPTDSLRSPIDVAFRANRTGTIMVTAYQAPTLKGTILTTVQVRVTVRDTSPP